MSNLAVLPGGSADAECCEDSDEPIRDLCARRGGHAVGPERPGGALVALPVAVFTDGVPHAPGAPLPALALAALALVGTPLPFWLFAFGQARVPAELAGAFLNLEPVVGAAAGWLALGEPASLGQMVGILAVLGGIAMSTVPPGTAADRAPVAITSPSPIRWRSWLNG
jgi:drug/metabolite transporter (DMT)-like permease